MAIDKEKLQPQLEPGRYVVAVSGGVDSVVLLDLVTKQPDNEYVAAHFDHGIRDNSSADAEFVRQLAKQYGVGFELGEGSLGSQASEAQARRARYDFLRSVKAKYNAHAIVTAHHQDDVIETAIINLLRGTYRKGLSSLRSGSEVLRPLVNVPRSAIESYAQEHGLEWREDPTNIDTRFLRNYVRHELIPAMKRLDSNWRQRILQRINKAEKLNEDINDVLDVVAMEHIETVKEGVTFDRHWLIMLPGIVAREVLLDAMMRVGVEQVNTQQLKKAYIFCKTAKLGKRMELPGNRELVIDGKQILITNH